MAKHSGRSTIQTRRQRKLRLQPMPLTRKVEHLTQTSNWIQKYYNFITTNMGTAKGCTSLLHRRAFCTQLDLLMICKVNTEELLTSMHRMVNLPLEDGKKFHTFASLAPLLNTILYIEISKLGPVDTVIQSLNWSRFRTTMS